MLYQSIWLFFVMILGAILFLFTPNPDIRGVAIWAKGVSTLFLFTYVFFTALGVGRKFQGLLHGFSKLEINLFSLIFGLALVSNGLVVLGLLGALNKLMIFSWLVLCGLAASFQWREIVGDMLEKMKSLGRFQFNSFGGFEYLFFSVAAFFALLLPIISLAPVRDYDALMYHLQIPRQFLEHGGIYFDPAVWRLSQPMLTEMLFLVGIVFHLESFSQLISLAYCAAFFLSVYAFGRRFFDSHIAILAVGILLGNTAFPVYATSPAVEFSWASYEFWSLYLFSIWLFSDRNKKHDYWLVFAGIMSGLAATTKYLSLPVILVLGFLIVGKTIQLEKGDFKKLARNVLMFGIPVLVVIAPWYLKNLIWTGNPFYPLVFGGPGWTALRQELILDDYVASFGTGTGWLDYLAMPVNMYLALPRFSTLSLEFFHPILWLGFAFVFTGKWRKHDYLVVYIVLSFILWGLSMRQIRFLLPLSGFLALLSAKVIFQFPRLIKQAVSVALVGGLMLVTSIYQLSSAYDSGLLNYFTGRLSESEFLQKEVYDYNTTRFIQENLKQTDRVLFLWSGQGYYCDDRCLPDGDQSLAIQLSITTPEPESLARQLHLMGVTHILLGRPDAYWFISLHDPLQRHSTALNYFETVFLPACGNSIFTDGVLELYSLTCK